MIELLAVSVLTLCFGLIVTHNTELEDLKRCDEYLMQEINDLRNDFFG